MYHTTTQCMTTLRYQCVSYFSMLKHWILWMVEFIQIFVHVVPTFKLNQCQRRVQHGGFGYAAYRRTLFIAHGFLSPPELNYSCTVSILRSQHAMPVHRVEKHHVLFRLYEKPPTAIFKLISLIVLYIVQLTGYSKRASTRILKGQWSHSRFWLF